MNSMITSTIWKWWCKLKVRRVSSSLGSRDLLMRRSSWFSYSLLLDKESTKWWVFRSKIQISVKDRAKQILASNGLAAEAKISCNWTSIVRGRMMRRSRISMQTILTIRDRILTSMSLLREPFRNTERSRQVLSIFIVAKAYWCL